MKILITGSNGFIGKNLVATLKGTDNELILIDRNLGGNNYGKNYRY